MSVLDKWATPSLPPSGAAITPELSQLIRAHWEISNRTASDKRVIAGMFATSVSTVDRVLDDWASTGAPRERHPGKGRKNDPRWIFEGPNGRLNRRRLDEAFQKGDASDPAADVLARFCEAAPDAPVPSLRCVQDTLLHGLEYKTKLLSKRARERDGPRCDQWIARMNTQYEARQLLFIDET